MHLDVQYIQYTVYSMCFDVDLHIDRLVGQTGWV